MGRHQFNPVAIFGYFIGATLILVGVLMFYSALPAAKSLHHDTYSIPGVKSDTGTVWIYQDDTNRLYNAALGSCPGKPTVTLSPAGTGYVATVRCGK